MNTARRLFLLCLAASLWSASQPTNQLFPLNPRPSYCDW
jgi:hypothetical protein